MGGFGGLPRGRGRDVDMLRDAASTDITATRPAK
jgi:hypothetical protein